jgi:hypothetical protein
VVFVGFGKRERELSDPLLDVPSQHVGILAV